MSVVVSAVFLMLALCFRGFRRTPIVLSIIIGPVAVLLGMYVYAAAAESGGMPGTPLGLDIASRIVGTVVVLMVLCGLAVLVGWPFYLVFEWTRDRLGQWIDDRYHDHVMRSQIKLKGKEAGRKARAEAEAQARREYEERGY